MLGSLLCSSLIVTDTFKDWQHTEENYQLNKQQINQTAGVLVQDQLWSPGN